MLSTFKKTDCIIIFEDEAKRFIHPLEPRSWTIISTITVKSQRKPPRPAQIIISLDMLLIMIMHFLRSYTATV